MAVSKQKKQEILQDLNEKLAKAHSITFIKNNGVSVEQITNLRTEGRKENIELKVAKKTLIQKAFEKNFSTSLPDEILDGPIITVMSYEDPISGPRIIQNFMKENKDKVEFKGGFMEGKVYNPSEIKAIANLPAKEVLIARVIGQMQAPLYGLHHALSFHLKGLVVALGAIAKNKNA